MKRFITSLLLLTTLLAPLGVVGSAAAVDVFQPCTGNTASTNPVNSRVQDSTVCKDVGNQNVGQTNPVINILKIALNTVALVAGIAVVVLIIINGLRLITANGDANGVKNARNGLIYVIVGAAIVLSSQGIVVFVLDKIK